MKRLHKRFIVLLTLVFLLSGYNGFTQAPKKEDLKISLRYFVHNNKIPYLVVNVKNKVIGGRLKHINGVSISLFLDKYSPGTFIGKVVTDRQGNAAAIIPAVLKNEWGSSIKHHFLAEFDGDKNYEPGKADLAIEGKAKILISTTSDKKITANVLEMKDTAWVPVKGVEIIIAVRRLGSDLPVNEKSTFTTDSTGQASADFKRDSIPGGATGNITLVAKIEDNDQYGNLSIEKIVPWGAKFQYVNTFNERTLFATRDKAPIWLQLIAYSIIFAVWGILITLVFNLLKIKKLGKKAQGL
jgi:hypothetical protein